MNIDQTRSDTQLKDNKQEDIKNIFQIRKNIPQCLKNIFDKCKISLKLSDEYDISIIEKNLNELNLIYKELMTSKDISVSPFYTQIHTLFKTGEWKSMDKAKSMLQPGQNLEYKINHEKMLQNHIYKIKRIIGYLTKDNKDEIKKILNEIQSKKKIKCDSYCCNIYCVTKKEDENCNKDCEKQINRFEILTAIVTVYQILKDKIQYNNIINSLKDEISELEKIIDLKDQDNILKKTKTDDKLSRELLDKYEQSILFLKKNNKDKKINYDIPNFDMFKNILENKKLYLNKLSDDKNDYDQCVKIISEENDCTDKL